MRRNTLLADLAIAVVLVAIVLILAPGLAVVGIAALVVLVVCLVWLGLSRMRARTALRRRQRVSATRRRPPRRL